MTEKDKKFILFNYRSLYSHIVIPKDISGSLEMGDKKINPNDSLYKYFAIIIEKIGQELIQMKTEFSNELLDLIDNEITDPKFYPLNRKLRNNIHYNKPSEISKTDFDFIKINQSIYINTCIEYIKSYLIIDLNEDVILMNEFMSLVLKSSIPHEELMNNYEEYYTSFIDTGIIKRK